MWAGREEKEIQGLARTCLGISYLMPTLLYLEVQGFLIFCQNECLLRTSLWCLAEFFSVLKTHQGYILVTVRKGSLREASHLPKEQENFFFYTHILLKRVKKKKQMRSKEVEKMWKFCC